MNTFKERDSVLLIGWDAIIFFEELKDNNRIFLIDPTSSKHVVKLTGLYHNVVLIHGQFADVRFPVDLKFSRIILNDKKLFESFKDKLTVSGKILLVEEIIVKYTQLYPV